ncbi:MAG TPA: hypothetical protein VFT50_06865 [Baekduia sp.]|nr:hypothetical protein [Baekduia sp.]
MTTFVPHESSLDERIREAWTAYRDDLADLDGREYDEAEEESWDRLQEALRGIEAERAPGERDAGADA